MIFKRLLEQNLFTALANVPVIALLGPRQVGKTTLSKQLSRAGLSKKINYLDLETDADFNKLSQPEEYLSRFDGELLVIDEVQLKPDLFRSLRAIVDRRKREGEVSGQFLLLGSASRTLLQQSSETLAGRIRYLELSPFSISEVVNGTPSELELEKLWLRGGFPDSYLAADDEQSWQWRSDFITTYVERDIPIMGAQVAPGKMKRFWSMLAHYHGQQVNLSELGKSLEVSHTTVRSYLDLMTDFYMVRQIQPWSGNTKKRLVKSPKVYLRDSGILHKLLNVYDIDTLSGHPGIGSSWEGFVAENIILQLSNKWAYSYYRTSAGAEVDLILEGPGHKVLAIEIKRSRAPAVSKGFYEGALDIKATGKYVVYTGSERYPLSNGLEAIGVQEFLTMVHK